MGKNNLKVSQRAHLIHHLQTISIFQINFKKLKALLPLCLGFIGIAFIWINYVFSCSKETENNLRRVKIQNSFFYPPFQGQPFGLRATGVQHITLVVAHCKASLDWLENYTLQYAEIDRMIIVSKCGQDVVGAPSFAKIVELPENVGRCDHSYAFLINLMMQTEHELLSSDHILIFLKDNQDNSHFPHFTKTISNLVHGASGLGFACQATVIGWDTFDLSAYASTEELLKAQFPYYERNTRNLNYGNSTSIIAFKSRHKSLEDWLKFIGVVNVPEVVQVCYGGNFAVRASNLKLHNLTLWGKLEASLSRGDSIEEGHFAERSWGMLIADLLGREQMESLTKFSNMILLRHDYSLHGLLARNFGTDERMTIKTWY